MQQPTTSGYNTLQDKAAAIHDEDPSNQEEKVEGARQALTCYLPIFSIVATTVVAGTCWATLSMLTGLFWLPLVIYIPIAIFSYVVNGVQIYRTRNILAVQQNRDSFKSLANLNIALCVLAVLTTVDSLVSCIVFTGFLFGWPSKQGAGTGGIAVICLLCLKILINGAWVVFSAFSIRKCFLLHRSIPEGVFFPPGERVA